MIDDSFQNMTWTTMSNDQDCHFVMTSRQNQTSCATTPAFRQPLPAGVVAAAAALLYTAADLLIARRLHGTGGGTLGRKRRTVGRAHALLRSAPRVLVPPD